MAKYLKISFDDDENEDLKEYYEHRNKPFANSPVYNASIEGFKLLTEGADVKTVYELKLSLKDVTYDFLPGDVIAILPDNDEEEVKKLLKRLNLESVAHKIYHLDLIKDTTRKNPFIPKHLPQCSTLYNVFMKYIAIRISPKKLFLRSLIQYTNDTGEKEKLELACSPSGSALYNKLMHKNRSLLALMKSFPSCLPPIELILEHSAPLNPRYFSIASSPLNKELHIIFNVQEHNRGKGGLKGVATGWLERIIKSQNPHIKQIPLYFRKPGQFRLNNATVPNVLIATGTGLAPFLGFLEHKKLALSSSDTFPTTWLFYGCRYSDRDFLCHQDLKSYIDNGVVTKMYTAFSRECKKKRYVQHLIYEHKQEVIDILEKGAIVYVCGDPKTVVKDVKEVFVKSFMECKSIGRSSAESILDDLIKSERFLVDTWI